MACPDKKQNEDIFRDTLEAYILQLSDLRDSLGSNLFQLLASRGLGDLLIEAGCYPIFPAVRDGLVEANLDEVYQAGDVVKMIEQILREAYDVESLVGIRDTLVDEISIEGAVEYIGNFCLVERQQQNAINLAIGVCLGVVSSENIWVISKLRKLETQKSGGQCLQVKAAVIDAEWDVPPASLTLPFEVEAKFRLTASFNQVLYNFDAIEICQNLPVGAMEEVIFCTLFKKQSCDGLTAKLDWKVGPEFEDSVRRLHLHNNVTVFRALLDACINTICELVLDKTHHLRTGPGSNNPQIVVGDFAAWRRDITYEFHLHYWRNGNICEFASCGVHNEFEIPNPS